MSATEAPFQNINDLSLKPRLLRSLLRDFVPDEKRPFRDPSDLSYVLSSLQTHSLLSESAPPSTDQDVLDSWKSAVDSWVTRLLSLASSKMPDKCWAGICLLGVTCQECGSERFLTSYSDWFNKLITYIQSPAETHILKAASCASLSDLLKRLARYPNEKKDANSQATKLIQPALKLLNDDSSEVVWEEAVCLLSTIISAFPSSIQRHYDAVEAAIVLKFMSEKCSEPLLKKLGHVLSLLPKSRGDYESWVLMMQKILISIDSQLEEAFQSLEEDSKRNKFKNLLLPPGKDPPPLLGGQVVQGVSLMKRPELLLMSRISTLIGCCCQLLTISYPVQVSVPVRALIALVERVLMVDGSSSHGLYPFLSTMKLETICSKLPLLHLNSLELLSSIIQGLRSLLLPHVSDIIRLLTVYFKKCKLPDLRIKVYSIHKDLLLSMGIGTVTYVAEVITSNSDLVSFDSGNGMSSSNINSASAETPSQPHQKKRKHAAKSASLSQQLDRVELDVDLSSTHTTAPVKVAALEALEALLIVGGSFRSKDWRSTVDPLLAKVAINACKDGFVKEEQFPCHLMDTTSTCTGFQLAALHAFLASLASPGLVRPQYLAQGLELFRRGSREGGARIADFCARSLMTLEVLIHPKTLSLVDFDNYEANHEFPDKMYFSGHARNPVYHSSMLAKGLNEPVSVFDDPLQSLLQSDDEMENPQADGNNISGAEESSKVPSSGNHPEGLTREAGVSAVASAKRVASEQSGGDYSAKGATTALISGGETTLSSGAVQSRDDALCLRDYSAKGATTALISGGETTLSSGAVQSRDDALCLSNDMEIENNVINDASSEMVKSKEFLFEMENQSDVDSIPDIVDGDPDSD